MDFNFEAVLWYILVADCAFANAVAWFYPGWYERSFPGISKFFPATRPWCVVYLLLTVWLGIALKRNGILPW